MGNYIKQQESLGTVRTNEAEEATVKPIIRVSDHRLMIKACRKA